MLAAILFLALLLLPNIIRSMHGNPTFIGEESYYHARVARQILTGQASYYDPYSYGHRPYDLNPYHFILAGMGRFVGIDDACKVLPILLGMLSLVLVFLISGLLRLNYKLRALVMLLWIISPITIYTFTSSTPTSLALCILLAGTYFFLRPGRISFVASAILFALVPLFGIYYLLVPVIVLLFIALKKKAKMNHFLIVFGVMLLVALIYNAYLVVVHNPLPQTRYIETNIIGETISDLGGISGFSAFSVVLLAIGIFLMWAKRKQNYPAYLLLIILALLSIFLNFSFIACLNLVVVYFCAAGVLNLLTKRWELRLIKNFTRVLIICGLLFSTVSYINREAAMEPDREMAASMLWLRDNSGQQDNVLSHYSNGFWIEYFSERTSVTDGLTQLTADSGKLFNLSSRIFYSRDLVETVENLKTLNVTYIVINNKMTGGEVWTKNKEGLLFLLRNSETFKKAYNSTSIDIWRFIKRGD